MISTKTQEFQIASAGRRFSARIIDVVFVSIAYSYIPKNETIRLGATRIIFPENFFALYVLSLFIFCILNIPFILHGQTIGKKLLKIKVVTRENKVPSIWKIIFIRELFFYSGIAIFLFILNYALDGIFEFMELASFLPDIPDKIANTHVVLAEN